MIICIHDIDVQHSYLCTGHEESLLLQVYIRNYIGTKIMPLNQCCPASICTRAHLTDAFEGAGAK